MATKLTNSLKFVHLVTPINKLCVSVFLQVERPSFSIESLRRHTADSKMDNLITKGNICQIYGSMVGDVTEKHNSRKS